MGRLLPVLVRRNGALIFVYTAAGFMSWGYIKLVAVNQSVTEFGRFAAVSFLGLILSAPLATLQSGVARQVSALRAEGREAEVPAYLKTLLTRSALPILIGVAVMFFLADPLARALRLDGAAGIQILLLTIVLFYPFHLVLGGLAGRERLFAYSTVLLLDASIRLGYGLLRPESIETTAGALSVYFGSLGIALIVGVVISRADFLRPGRVPLAGLHPVVPIFILGTTLLYLLAFQDAYLVRLVLDPISAARYGAAATVGRLVHLLPLPMIPALVPLVTRLATEGKSPRRVLLFHLFLVFMPGAAAVVLGLLRPDLVGALILDPAAHRDLGALVPLAFLTATFHALSLLGLSYLLALRRSRILIVLFAAVPIGAALILLPPADPVFILARMAVLAGAVCALVLFFALAPRGGRA